MSIDSINRSLLREGPYSNSGQFLFNMAIIMHLRLDWMSLRLILSGGQFALELLSRNALMRRCTVNVRYK